MWLLDDEIVGFSSTDRIEFGEQAFMHLHILDSGRRHTGLGARFVRLSAPHYVEVLQLHRLYCQPNAFNIAANRTLQRAGFQYVMTLETTPSAINFPQAVTRWVWEPAGHGEPADAGRDGERTNTSRPRFTQWRSLLLVAFWEPAVDMIKLESS